MTATAKDTSDQAEEVQLQVLRELGPERRSQLATQWSDQLREIAMQGIRDRSKELDHRWVILEYARTTLGEELYRAAFAGETMEPE